MEVGALELDHSGVRAFGQDVHLHNKVFQLLLILDRDDLGGGKAARLLVLHLVHHAKAALAQAADNLPQRLRVDAARDVLHQLVAVLLLVAKEPHGGGALACKQAAPTGPRKLQAQEKAPALAPHRRRTRLHAQYKTTARPASELATTSNQNTHGAHGSKNARHGSTYRQQKKGYTTAAHPSAGRAGKSQPHKLFPNFFQN